MPRTSNYINHDINHYTAYVRKSSTKMTVVSIYIESIHNDPAGMSTDHPMGGAIVALERTEVGERKLNSPSRALR